MKLPYFAFFVFVFIATTFLGTSAHASVIESCQLPAGNVFTRSYASGNFFDTTYMSGGSKQFAAAPASAGSIQFGSASYSVAEDGFISIIVVTRTGGSDGTVMVNFATSNGTATNGVDYTGSSGVLLWEDGDNSPKAFSIPIIDDEQPEGNETVKLTLSGVTGGATLGSPSTATLTIIDDDGGSALSINDVSQPEGNGPNQMVFDVTLSPASSQTVTVNYSTVNGTAVAPTDFTPISSGVLQFNPGETLKQIVVDINGDFDIEPNETFSVVLSNATGAIIADGQGVGTLLNDDVLNPGTIQLSSGTYSVSENVGNATITVTRAGGSSAASVQYSTSNGSATAGQDYTAVSGTLTWAQGDPAAKTFTVPITDDIFQEGSETIHITLSNPGGGAALGSPSAAVLTIIDNDTLPEISINDVSQAEGNAGNQMIFTVSLSNAFGSPVTVTYATEDGTAFALADYVAIPPTQITFSPGEVSKQIAVNIIGDFIIEPDEWFYVNLTNATNAIISDSQGVGTILNDDSAGTIQFSAANYTVLENAGKVAVKVTRTGGISQGVTVQFVTVDGTALAGEDYISQRRTLMFAPGEAEKTIEITILDDNIDEADETINLALEHPSGGSILGTPINSIVTIVDNDAEPQLSVSDVSVNEGNSGTTPMTFTISLDGQSAEPVTVFYSTSSGTASSPEDYTAIPLTEIDFLPGETSKQITVLINGDFTNESNETIFFNISQSLGASIADPQGVGTIINDDFGGAFKFSSAEYIVSETHNLLTVTVMRTGGTAEGVSVDYSTAAGTALPGLDFTPVSGTLHFSGGQTSRTFTVPISNDGITEADENFLLILSNAAGSGATLGSPNTATVHITDGPLPIDSGTAFDYDGDGRADITVRRPSNNIWYLQQGTAGYVAMQWGVDGDKMAPADYDGDGKTDVAVFRPSNGSWYIYMSESGTFHTFGWGADGDIPVPADRDADGKDDLVVYRPSNNTFYTRYSSNGSYGSTVFGLAGDWPVIGDFDGDGRSDLAVYRSSNGEWLMSKSTEGYSAMVWGEPGDIPVPADYDGDGRTDLAIFRASTGRWYRNMSTAGSDMVSWGANGDVPVVTDYDGDGKADTALFRPANATWYIIGSTTGMLVLQYGESQDVPTPSAYLPVQAQELRPQP